MSIFSRLPFSSERQLTRIRLQRNNDKTAGRTGGIVLGAFCAIALFLSVFSFSFSQVSEPDRVKDYIGLGVAALTEIEQHLANELPGLREIINASDETSFLLPNFPLDIALSRDEIFTASNDEVRQLVLVRAGSLIYEEGFIAFDRTGQQDFGYFSLAFVFQQALMLGDAENHMLSSIFALVTFIVAVFAGIGVVVSARGYHRFRNIGLAALFSAIPALLLILVVIFVVHSFVDTDLFAQDMLSIFENIMAIFLRNFLIVAIFGCFCICMSWVFSLVVKMVTFKQSRTFQ